MLDTRLILSLAAGVWLGSCAIVDLRTGLVPNLLTLPAIAGGTLFTLSRVVIEHDYTSFFVMLGLWVTVTVPWLMEMYGGGDQKVLMALSSFIPAQSTLFWISVGLVFSWLIMTVVRFGLGKGRMKERWYGRWMLVPGGLFAIAQQLLLVH